MPSGVYIRTKEHRKKISDAIKGENHPMFGKKHTEDAKIKIGLKSKGRCAGEKSNFWKGGINTIERRRWLKNKRNRLKGHLNRIGYGHSFEEWISLKKRCDFTCLSCKKKEPEIKLTEDHIIPLSKNGSDLIENIQPLCLGCNLRKHDKIIKY